MTDAIGAISANVAAIRARINGAARRSGRDPAEVTLVAAAKNAPPELVLAAVAAGVPDIGENRAQELLAAAPWIAGHLTPGDLPDTGPVRWHFIGALQRNKVRQLAPWVSRWQSVDREPLGVEIARHAPGARILVEVNLGGETRKAGCGPDDAPALIERLRELGLAVDGLMTIPPPNDDPRRWFVALRELAAKVGVRELSMGMTEDFETAIEEGATIVRVGRAIFGARP